ncbi:hypothetical protein DL95DRAFT_407870 [Leptodontidium sp. 2 PMI_412]|nr:hypothetical protein DL95DRAFT_407870 [Leptodontidium sp. 2 PMI_412]
MSKSFVDNTSDVVVRSLRGIVRVTPSLVLDTTEKIIFRRDLLGRAGIASTKVLLLSGGGSGHEPAHAGFVGEGMLDVAVAGNVFAPPSASQIFKALKAFPSEQGTLIIMKNCTGDALSFGLATEKARAAELKCKLLIVGGDITIPRKPGLTVGRRGLAGVALVHKIAGAAAAEGEVLTCSCHIHVDMADLREKRESRRCIFGCRISRTEPGHDRRIHNEPGAQRAIIKPLDEVVKQLLRWLLSENERAHSFLQFAKTDEIALTINNLAQLSSDYGITPKRLIRGTLVSSINGLGFSITLLKLNDRIIPLLDRVTDAPG